MTIGNIVSAMPALKKVSAADMRPKTLYRVSRLLDQLDHILVFYNERRAKLIKQLGHTTEDGWRVDDENVDAYQKEMAEVLGVEVVDEIVPVRLPMDENIRLSYQDLCLMRGLIELETEGD